MYSNIKINEEILILVNEINEIFKDYVEPDEIKEFYIY